MRFGLKCNIFYSEVITIIVLHKANKLIASMPLIIDYVHSIKPFIIIKYCNLII